MLLKDAELIKKQKNIAAHKFIFDSYRVLEQNGWRDRAEMTKFLERFDYLHAVYIEGFAGKDKKLETGATLKKYDQHKREAQLAWVVPHMAKKSNKELQCT